MEMLKDYGISILNHPGKTNMTVDVLSRNAVSMGILDSISNSARLLVWGIYSLANLIMWPDSLDFRRIFASFEVSSTLFKYILSHQFKDRELYVICD